MDEHADTISDSSKQVDASNKPITETIEKENTPFRKSAHFAEVTIMTHKNASKGQEKKRRKFARLMFHLTEIRNVRLRNALDVDLKIT